MPKRTLAALCAVLAFAAVLVVVPLATADDAGADTRTKTVQRCSYDPFAGRQCWTETVSVSHVHSGAGMTGTYPNCYPIPPATQPVCPAGMTGTPPNCYPPPTTTTEPPPPPTTATPPPTTAAPPPTTQPPPPTTTIYVPPTTTTTTTAPRACIPPRHRHGSTCHHNHSDPPCGTGLWTPHNGHPPQQRPPCTTEPPKTTEPPACETDQHRHGITQNRSGADSGCHYVSASHCAAGYHEHAHGSGACHSVGNERYSHKANHFGDIYHCSAGEHEHPHGLGNCHDADTLHCHHHPSANDPTPSRCHDAGIVHTEDCPAGQHKHDAGLGGCHPVDEDKCPAGQHEHVETVRWGCHSPDLDHFWSSTSETVLDATGLVLCAPAHLIKRIDVSFLVGQGCEKVWEEITKSQRETGEAKEKEHDEAAKDDDADDSDSDDGDSDGAPKPPTLDQMLAAQDAYERGELSREKYRALHQSYICQNSPQHLKDICP